MAENPTVKDADPILFAANAPDEICRISSDGTTTYHWDYIEVAAQRWEPGCVDIAICLARLLLPLRPRREWQSLSKEERDAAIRWAVDQEKMHFGRAVARAIEQALKEKNA
jgi:hypothetical protein